LFTDNHVASKTYYRIKSIDQDGRASYSRVVSFSMNITGMIAIAGNPVKPGVVELTVSNTALLQKEKVQVKVFDMAGYLVLSEQAKPATTMQFDGSRLKQGNYILIIQADELFQKTRFIVQ
jgi:hypothetical protein